MKLETKFSIGDVVFSATTTSTAKQHPCPDCRGARKWKAISPAGGEYEFGCPRCAGRFHGEHKLNLNYHSFDPAVHVRTIGSVRLNTAARDGDDPVEYMCHETGVGSGTSYQQRNLFATREEADQVAALKAAAQNKTTPWVVEQYAESLDLCDYQMESAALKIGRDYLIKTNTDVRMLFEDLRDCEDMDAIRVRLEEGFKPRTEVEVAA